MAEQRLYIDDQLVDVDSDTKLTLDIKSNLFQDVSKLVSNSTFSVKLPKTVRNQRIFQHADKVQNGGTDFPYKLHTARYFRNGVQLISNGRAVCLSVGDSIEISIVWGLFPAFTNIQSNGTTLNQLNSSARLKYAGTAYDQLDAALAQGYCYAVYDPFHLAETGDEWTSGSTPEGALSTNILSLETGAIETGEIVGATLSPVINSEMTTYAAVIYSFKVGQTLRIRGAVGGDTKYRLYAVLDAANSVIKLGDASTADTAAADYDVIAPSNADRIIVNVIKARSPSYQIIIAEGATSSQARARAKTYGGGHGTTSGTNISPYIHPTALVPWVLNLIWEQTGVHFVWTGEAADLINRLAIPLVNNKSNDLSLDGSLDAEFVARAGCGALQVKLKSASTLFSNAVGVATDTLTVATNASVIMDVQCHWDWSVGNSKPQGSTTTYIDGVAVTTYTYAYWHNYFVMRVTPASGDEEDIKEYIIGDETQADGTNARFDSSDNLVDGRFYHLGTGYGKIELQVGDKITFEMRNARGNLHDVKCSGGTIKGTIDAGDSVPRGGYFPIAYNLPAIKIIDFVKFLAAITGTFPRQMGTDNAVEFVPFETLWTNIDKAQDWSMRVVAQSLYNKPKELEFKIGDYAQLNYYKWKEDDYTYGDHDGTLEVSNQTLDDEKTVITFPFAASDGNRVPTYTRPSDKSGTFGNSSEDEDDSGDTTSDGTYKACKERIMQIYANANGEAALKFELNMQNILNQKYGKLRDSLQAAKVIKERIMLSDVDLLNFDETVPVYLAQYGAFFAVTEIKQASTYAADVTMFQIKEKRTVAVVPKDIKITVTAVHNANGYAFTWASDAPLGSTLSLTLTGDTSVEGIELAEGKSGGSINYVMSGAKPVGCSVVKSAEDDVNTYTSELVFGNEIEVTIGMGSTLSKLKFTASEALTSPIKVVVVVKGTAQHKTSATIPTGATEGEIGINDGYVFGELVFVSSTCIQEDTDTNIYYITSAFINTNE
jgi:hypothetical protein